MNRMEPAGRGGVAVLQYQDGDFQVVRPGTHVVCAVTGADIPLRSLKYWSVARQEAYASAEAAAQRFAEAGAL